MNESIKMKTIEKGARILSFLLPVIIMLAIFVGRGIYPFGNRSFLSTDMYHQYMPFFTEFMEKIRNGESLGYSWETGLGSNFLALYVYYLASPVHFLGLLVSKSHIMEFLSYLVIIKIGLCGFSSYIYLAKREKCENGSPLFFSLFYALSGFMAAYNWNIMWLDCVILLPIILLGLEMLVKEGKGVLYCLTLALSIYTNYYLSIMICLFVILYFAVLVVSHKVGWEKVGLFFLYSLLAGGIAGILLIPEICAVLATDFGEVHFPKEIKFYFNGLEILGRHCIGVMPEKKLDHWPNIYCSAAVFILVPLYVINDRISLKERLCSVLLMGFMIVSFGTNVLDFLWHGMNYPDSLPARQSFIYCLFVISICYRGFQQVKELKPIKIWLTYLGTVVFLLLIQIFAFREDFAWWSVLLSFGFVTLYTLVIYMHSRGNSARKDIILVGIVLVAVILESSINTEYTSVPTCSRDAYLDDIEDYRKLYELTKEQDEGFYRLEKFTRTTKNDAMLAHFPSATVFSSTMNSQVMDMYHRLGMQYSKVFYCFDGATALTSALLNVKYMYGDKEGYDNRLYKQVEKSGDVVLYKCTKTLPFGYVVPSGYDLPEGYINSPLRLQNKLVNQLGISELLFREVNKNTTDENVSFTVHSAGIYYGVVESNGTKKIVAQGGVLEEQRFKDLKKGEILSLGFLKAGQKITLRNDDEEDDSPDISVKIYRMNDGVLQKTLNLLGKQHMTEICYDSASLQGRISLEEAGRVILSVPMEEGWKITVNGEKVEPSTFAGALIALDLDAGEYEIAMKYVPQGKEAGILMSIGSLLFLAGFLIVKNYQKLRIFGY